MKFLVTGATGLVGSNIVKTILKERSMDQILSLGRNETKLQEVKQLGSEIMKFDITGSDNEYQKLSSWGGSDAIWIHCAAAITGAPDDDLEKVNISGTTKVVKFAEKFQVSKLIMISSIAVYGLHSNNENGFKEDDPKKPQSKYGYSKLGQEKILLDSHLNYVIFRPPFIGGPGDINVLPGFYERMKHKKMPLFSKKGHFGYVDARDIAYAVIQAINISVYRQSYNIQGIGLQLDDFIHQIGKSTGLSPPYGRRYPYFMVMSLGIFMDIIGKIQRRSMDRSISRYRIKSLTSNRLLDTSKAKQELDFDPQFSLSQSIEDWFASYQSNSSS